MEIAQNFLIKLINSLIDQANTEEGHKVLNRINISGAEEEKPANSCFVTPFDEDEDYDDDPATIGDYEEPEDYYDEDEDYDDCSCGQCDDDQSDAIRKSLISTIGQVIKLINDNGALSAADTSKKTERTRSKPSFLEDDGNLGKTQFQKHLDDYQEEDEEPIKTKSLKTKIFDFIQKNGPCSREDIKKFIIENVRHEKYDRVKHRTAYDYIFYGPKSASYFYPSADEDRYLVKVDRGVFDVTSDD